MTTDASVRATSNVERAKSQPAGAEAGRDAQVKRPVLQVVADRHHRARRNGRRTALVALAIAVAAPLAVVGAYADLTSGQVRLTRLQQELTVEQQRQSALELRVARLQNPSMIVAEARAQGMVPASSVTDIPEVPLGAPASNTSSSGGSSGTATGSGPTTSTVGTQ